MFPLEMPPAEQSKNEKKGAPPVFVPAYMDVQNALTPFLFQLVIVLAIVPVNKMHIYSHKPSIKKKKKAFERLVPKCLTTSSKLVDTAMTSLTKASISQ